MIVEQQQEETPKLKPKAKKKKDFRKLKRKGGFGKARKRGTGMSTTTIGGGKSNDPLHGLNSSTDPFIFEKPRFMYYEEYSHPLLRIEMLYSQESGFRFKEDEQYLWFSFNEYTNELIQTFSNFKNPEYVEIDIDVEDDEEERAIAAQKRRRAFDTENNFLSTNHDYIYRSVLDSVQMKELKPKKKVNLIGLEDIQNNEEPIPEFLNICSVDELFFEQNIKITLTHIIDHFKDCEQSFAIFNQFKPLLTQNLTKRVKKLSGKKEIELQVYRRFIHLFNKYETLLF